jgi:hypothetical protein
MYNNQINNSIKLDVSTQQSVYDGFNSFIFNKDLKVFGKLIARTNLFNEVKDIPGDIIECGVYKGSGIFTWLKLKQVLLASSNRKIIGFDMFDENKLLSILDGKDLTTMKDLFQDRKFEYLSYKDTLTKMIQESGFTDCDFELIEGDVCKTSHEYVKERPGLRISLLYLDMDIEKPTYEALSAFWPKISKGGLVVLDEYACHQWTESDGVDRFLSENNLQIKMLNYSAPTAYIKKL